ncbi:MAG: hypothetical protein L3J05_07930 [Robiginitomaculum sp.]|nr:hypothetical protein [Robiginitomaculum sp.]
MGKKKVGAPKRFKEHYDLRLPAGTLARVAAVSECKADFFRAAVLEALYRHRKQVLTPGRERGAGDGPKVFRVGPGK